MNANGLCSSCTSLPPPLPPGAARGVASLTQTLRVSEKKPIDHSPPSRPTPLCLTPPNGVRRSRYLVPRAFAKQTSEQKHRGVKSVKAAVELDTLESSSQSPVAIENEWELMVLFKIYKRGWGIAYSQQLTQRMPDSIRLATSYPRRSSDVHTDPARPYFVTLAIAIASSSVAKRCRVTCARK